MRKIESSVLKQEGTMGQAQQAMVAACHGRSADIGVEILKRGGNAADAFIAATFADYVQTPGCSSVGGPLGVLVYEANDRKIKSLMAPLKTVKPDGTMAGGRKGIGNTGSRSRRGGRAGSSA